MKKTKEKNLVKRFVWCECIIMTLILLVSFAAVLFMVIKSMANPELTSGAIESTLMSTGLSIIGIAVSVWAGLNIIQVLEKDKLLELEKQAAAYKRERHILNKRDFLENVLAEKNELNSYIYKKLEQSSEQETEEISSELYFELNLIERMFQTIYRERLPVYRAYTNDYYDNAVKKCEQLGERLKRELSTPDVYLEYLKIRILEFNFYKGYTQKSKDEGTVLLCFENVIQGFTEIFEGLKEPERIVREKRYLEGDISLTVYMLNTLGESYSKIVETYENTAPVTETMKMQAENAKRYFEVLLALIESDAVKDKTELKRNIRETYYRNYGCALERISRKIDKNEKEVFVCDSNAHRMYQKALDVVLSGYEIGNRHHPFYTYLSFYVKTMRNYDIEEILNDRGKKYSTEQKKYKNFTQNAFYYVDVAEKNFPTMIHFVKFRAFVERDLAIWAIKEKDYERAERHWEMMKSFLEQFRLFEEGRIALGEKADDALKELENSLSVVKKALKKRV